jgi:ABC-type sugar transport system permease subunit
MRYEKSGSNAWLYLLPSALIMLFILGYPIAYNFVISFFRWTLNSP